MQPADVPHHAHMPCYLPHDGEVNDAHTPVNIAVLNTRDAVLVCLAHKVVLDQSDVAHVAHVPARTATSRQVTTAAACRTHETPTTQAVGAKIRDRNT